MAKQAVVEKENKPSFLLESDYASDEKFLELEDELGLAGEAVAIRIIGKLRTASDYKLSYRPSLIAKAIRVDMDLTRRVLEVGLRCKLFALDDDDRLYAPALLARMDRYNQKRERLSANAKLRWQKRKETPSNQLLDSNAIAHANAMQPDVQLQCLSEIEKKQIEINKNINIKKGGTRGKTILASDAVDDLEIPSPFDADQIRASLKTWVEYKRDEHNEGYKSLAPLKATLTKAQKTRASTELFLFAVDYAISRKWHGIEFYSEVVEQFNRTSKPGRPLSGAELAAQMEGKNRGDD